MSKRNSRTNLARTLLLGFSYALTALQLSFAHEQTQSVRLSWGNESEQTDSARESTQQRNKTSMVLPLSTNTEKAKTESSTGNSAGDGSPASNSDGSNSAVNSDTDQSPASNNARDNSSASKSDEDKSSASKSDEDNSSFQEWDPLVSDITEALNANDIRKARSLSEELTAKATKDGSHAALATALAAQGWIHTSERNYKDAIHALKSSLKELTLNQNKSAETRVGSTRRWLVTCYLHLDRLKDALKVLNEQIKDDRELAQNGDSNDSSLGYDLGLSADCHFRLGKYSEAERDAKEACRRLLFASPPGENQTKTLIHDLRLAAKSDIMLWKFDDAENTCKMALALASADSGKDGPGESDKNAVILDLARAQIGCGKYDEAEKNLRAALPLLRLQKGWMYAAALEDLAKLEAEQAKYDEAAVTYNMAAQVISDDKSLQGSTNAQLLYFAYARVLAQLGRLNEAEDYMTKAEKQLPDSSLWKTSILYQQSALLRQDGRDKQARHRTHDFVSLRNKLLKKDLGEHFSDLLEKTSPPAPLKNWVITADDNLAKLNEKLLNDLIAGLKTIPEEIQERLHSSGVIIVIVPSMSDLPGEKGLRPPGYSSGATLSNEQGHTAPGFAAVFIAEKYKKPHKLTWSNVDNAAHAIRHELGHALDAYLMDFSDRKEFVEAYRQDTAHSSSKLKKILSYLLQPGKRGRRETFAELAALCWGSSEKVPELQEQFPRCIKLIKQRLAELDRS